MTVGPSGDWAVNHPDGVVDSHVHMWDLSRRPQPWIDPVQMEVIDRSFSLDELAASAAQAGVEGAVLVQTLNNEEETREYLREGLDSPLIESVVGWVDVQAPDLDDRLDALRESPGGGLLVGIRHQAQAEPDPGEWLDRPGVLSGIAALGRRGLVFDLMLRPAQLSRAIAVAHEVPDVVLVLDHAGKPPVLAGWSSDEAAAWAGLVGELARNRNVVCKLSGLTTMAELSSWSVADLRPFADHLLEVFGPGRLMFGSDWPVSLRAGDYTRTVAAVRDVLADLSPHERRDVLAANARRLYGLDR